RHLYQEYRSRMNFRRFKCPTAEHLAKLIQPNSHHIVELEIADVDVPSYKAFFAPVDSIAGLTKLKMLNLQAVARHDIGTLFACPPSIKQLKIRYQADVLNQKYAPKIFALTPAPTRPNSKSQGMAQSIGTNSMELRSINQPVTDADNAGHDTLAVMEAVAEQKRLIKAAFTNCEFIHSKMVQTILSECRAVEEVWIDGKDSSTVSIRLEDAVEKP
ncbi:hypothetical protein BGX23_002323, partial [Mortierella sp. AD031]